MKELRGVIDAETTADIFQTLYHRTMKELKGKTFGYWAQVDVGFFEEGNEREIAMLTLQLPIAKMRCKKGEWEALLKRLAIKLTQKMGVKMHVATQKQIDDFFINQSLAHSLMKEPPEGKA